MNNSVSEAQGTFWSPQAKIPVYETVNYEQPPYLIADQNHVVHAFNAQSLILDDENSPKAIVYRQWTLEYGWTYPNDILYDETGGDLELVGVSSDQAGMVHLVYQKNFDDLYYTNAYLADADSSLAWSIPVFIDGRSLHISPGIPNVGAIANDNTSGQIVIVFSGSQYGNGLYYAHSSDNGLNWTDPYPIYLTGSGNFIVSDPKLYMDESGILHLVWTTINEDGFGELAFYAKYNLVENIWSDSIEIDLPGIQTPAIGGIGGDIFIGYYRQDNNQNWWRRISDNGETWSFPSPISENYIGRNGAVSFVSDNNENLHVFFAQRNKGNIHGMWHGYWNGKDWVGIESVVQGPSIQDVIGGNGFDPNSARAIISNGNVILVTWGTDGGVGQNGAWYSYKILDVPEIPRQSLPSPILATKDDFVVDLNQAGNNRVVGTSVVPSPISIAEDNGNISSPLFPLSVAVFMVVLVIVGVFLMKMIEYFRQ